MSDPEKPVGYHIRGMSIVGSDDMGTSAPNRREEADELLIKIQAGHLNADTLEALKQILDYECLYLKPVSQDDPPDRRQSDPEALQPLWTDRVVRLLASGMCQVNFAASYYQREIQYRALLSALALQRAQGARSFQADHYDELQRQFGQGHRGVQWQHVPPTEFSTEKYRIYNCHFLLATIVEYSKNFKRNEPVIAEILNRAMNILLVGSTIALAASMNGVGAPVVESVIFTLTESFSRLQKTPGKRSKEVFALQEVTRYTLVSELQSQNRRIVPSINHHQPSVNRYTSTSKWILKTILSLLNAEKIDQNVSEPPNILQNVRAFFSMGPASFSIYYYWYALLDCATQIGRIIEKENIPEGFPEKKREIVKKSKSTSIRWKAIEVLFVTKLWINGEEIKLRIDSTAVEAIRNCLAEQTSDPVPLEIEGSSSGTTHSSSSNTTLPIIDKMIPKHWEENEMDFPPLELTTTSERSRVVFERRRFTAEEYYSSGLSPDCKAVFYLCPRSVVVYSLKEFRQITESDVLLRKRPDATESYIVARATLTNRFLAIASQGIDSHPHKLLVLEHSAPGTTNTPPVSESLSIRPTCLAMYESGDRIWVVVGGQANKVGKIQVYRVENVAGIIRLRRQKARFDKLESNALLEDWPKTIDFSPDGRRLLCVTHRTNKVLVWFLSDHACPKQAAFEIMKTYDNGTRARGIESVSLFYSPSSRPYILCATSPSGRRSEHNGEWPFISPVHLGPVGEVPDELQHDFAALRESNPILASAVSSHLNVAAMLEASGNLLLYSLTSGPNWGIRPLGNHVVINNKVSKHNQSLMSSTSVRFCFNEDTQTSCLFAVDIEGVICKKTF